jgi:hypothetical protein
MWQEELDDDPGDHEYRAKPYGQRALVPTCQRCQTHEPDGLRHDIMATPGEGRIASIHESSSVNRITNAVLTTRTTNMTPSAIDHHASGVLGHPRTIRRSVGDVSGGILGSIFISPPPLSDILPQSADTPERLSSV